MYDVGGDVRSFLTLSRFENISGSSACSAILERTNYFYREGHKEEILFSKKYNIVKPLFEKKELGCQVEENKKFSFEGSIFVDGTLAKRELGGVLVAKNNVVNSFCDKAIVNKKEDFWLFKVVGSYDFIGPDYYLFYKANSIKSEIIRVSANLDRDFKLSVLGCDYTLH